MLLVYLISVLLSSHPVHVSIANIEYTPAKGRFVLYLKVWKDDFLTDYYLSENANNERDIFPGFFPEEEEIEQYVGRRLKITAEGNNLNGTIEKIVAGESEVEIYMSYRYKGKAENFTIHNSIMAGLYNDQSNMLIFKYKGTEEGVKFTPSFQEKVFEVK